MDTTSTHDDRHGPATAPHPAPPEPSAHDAFPAQFARTQRYTLGVPRAFTLAADGTAVLFLRTRGPEDRTGCLWLIDDDGERLLVDPDGLGAGPAGVPEAERIRRERAREHTAGVVAYDATADLATVVFAVDGALWCLEPRRGAAPRPVATAGPVVDPRLAPDGRHVAYVTGGALHVAALDGGDGRLLAAPESADVTYGLAEHVAAESMGRHRGHWWAPDGRRLLAARVDTTGVRRWWIADPSDPSRPPREVAYPAAGTDNAEVSLSVFGLDGTTTPIAWDRAAYEYLAAVAWDAHGPLLSVQSRDQGTLRVLAADPATGATRLLHEQRDPAWVELIPGTPARTASGALVHTADLGGTRRLTVAGTPVTPEGLQIRAVEQVTGETVLFTASDEPTEAHLWSYAPDAGLVPLSSTPGVHTGQRAGGTLLLASRTDAGPETRLLREGAAPRTVACLAAEPVTPPRVTWLRAGEAGIRTALLLPSWYRPGGGPLPVLLAPYGGPAMQLVTRGRNWPLVEGQWFAEEGFAVVIADGRGTPGRGPAWEKTVHRDTLSAPVEDQVTALHAAAAHCRDLDLGRVAIRGWSYGGTLATAAVLRRPDVFHAAISGAGPSDQRLYDTHWRERFLGHPGNDPEAYDRSSPIGEAAALRRPLLLVHGLADDNVVAAHTLRMSAALLAAHRPHQVLPLSNVTHGPSDPVVVEGLLRHQLNFLRASLNVSRPQAV
ncbi:S9 family peptidase [Actinacidiphila acidipaludis]|uniref:Prolyl oligopeptidase family serine peptidase n=1 Tax=Actinacidiphila acidipaludis TaxID=2873382 RepID=A0ABS7QGN7_9ACTN|nr:prolyl oligopeptidase family serine peptidase [Streptomyces acidipaludis]MBY8882336.1 prolyl oligopeptidase family serine peptidase [Streptomyces acidipaludis]